MGIIGARLRTKWACSRAVPTVVDRFLASELSLVGDPRRF